MDPFRRDRLYRTGVSIFIIGMLAAQASTLLVTATYSSVLRSKPYPFIEYPMYGIAHYEGERVTATWHLEGIYEDGRSIDISRAMLGLSIWDYNRMIQSTMARQKGAADSFRKLIRERVPASDALRQIRIENYAIKVTRHGPETIPSEVAMAFPMTPAS